MELTKKNVCGPIVPGKRSYEDSNDRDHKNLKRPNLVVQTVQNVHSDVDNLRPNKFGRSTDFTGTRPPSGKVKFWDPRSLNSGGAHKPKVTTTVTVRKPLQPLKGADADVNVKINSRVNIKYCSLNSQSFEQDKLKSKKQPEVGRKKPSSSSKPAGKVMFWDPLTAGHDQQPKVTTTVHVSRGKPLQNAENVVSDGEAKRRKEGKAQKSAVTTTTASQKENKNREKIKEAMNVFDQVHPQLLDENRMKINGEKIGNWRVPLEAVKITKQMLKWMEPVKSLGPICGVKIGDKFKYRAQLKMIGLHCQLQSGIDYTKIEGKNLAISIVDSHRYANETGSADTLIYCGHGGHSGLKFLGPKSPPEDQELKRGNLALKNSMDERTVIRVIKKLEFGKDEVFVYDGLYVAIHYTRHRNEDGKTMFKYHLNRVPGQPALHRMLNASY
ncbi:histone-lysine N-methyltransferase, H3 lysine-9 specific SUVH6-like [Bidens hawaiensis]|uniref:histone-lysine N-methyltransferase, H3 lysine-9 specific SUVH6-like n=1 Tax=Bidens hawaiensis TaxID=980011 RepID=UPI004049A2A6